MGSCTVRRLSILHQIQKCPICGHADIHQKSCAHLSGAGSAISFIRYHKQGVPATPLHIYFCYVSLTRSLCIRARSANSLGGCSSQFRQWLGIGICWRSIQESRSNEPSEVSTHLSFSDSRAGLFPMADSQVLRIRVVQFRRLCAGRQVIQHKVQKREQGVILNLEHVLLELSSPR